MIILLLGAPGAGKGTQAKMLEEKFGLHHLAPGDILRDEIKRNTEIGKIAKFHMDKGHLVPDDMIISMMLQTIDREPNIILDGFPRNIAQAESLAEHLKENNKKLDLVLKIRVSEEEIIRRLSGRRVCPKCGASYNVVFNPPEVEGICDKDGQKLVQRKDDTEETIKQRFKVFKEQTKPLVDYYENKRELVKIDGERDHNVIFDDICDILSKIS